MTNIVARETGEKSEPLTLPHLASLSLDERRRLEVIQGLESHRGQSTYREAENAAAATLSLSVRNLKRLVRHYREQGIEGLKRQPRRDEGALRVDDSWRAFILESYRKGNRGTRKTSRAQIAKQVESHAAAIGSPNYPSRRTVYRILSGEISQAEQKQKKRSIGWQGDTLQLTTKSGIAIAVDYSNQVWQCDHTPADIVASYAHFWCMEGKEGRAYPAG
jgi:putative transposase